MLKHVLVTNVSWQGMMREGSGHVGLLGKGVGGRSANYGIAGGRVERGKVLRPIGYETLNCTSAINWSWQSVKREGCGHVNLLGNAAGGGI
jgi:hypothetical protein